MGWLSENFGKLCSSSCCTSRCVFSGPFYGGLIPSFFWLFVAAGLVIAYYFDCPPQQSILDFVFQLILAGCIVFVFRFKKGFGLTAGFSSSCKAAEAVGLFELTVGGADVSGDVVASWLGLVTFGAYFICFIASRDDLAPVSSL